MVEILLKTLPFFAVIALGYVSGRTRFFTPEATAYLTRFVFYFALSAMIFNFSASLDFARFFSWAFVGAYLSATLAVYLLVTVIALLRRKSAAEAAFEAQCGVIGNIGFLGIPMLTLLLGPNAAAPIILMLAVDLIVFSSLLVIIVTGSRGGGLSPRIVVTVLTGLVKNPMIVSIVAGLLFARSGLTMPVPAAEFLVLLGAAATPGALFAIGASLADKAAQTLGNAVWLSVVKLIVHPIAVAIAALWVFEVEPYSAGVMIAASALPVAGNVYILAQHYGVAPRRVSAAILISTAASIVTVAAFIAWIATL